MAHMLARGKTLYWKNSTGSDVASGDPVLVGDTLTVAETNILNGNSGALNLEGVYQIPKAAEGLLQGKRVYWDDTAKNITLVSTDNSFAGVVYETSVTEDTTVAVKING